MQLSVFTSLVSVRSTFTDVHRFLTGVGCKARVGVSYIYMVLFNHMEGVGTEGVNLTLCHLFYYLLHRCLHRG